MKVNKVKTKSGCRTCKTRHIKCDEGKPFCSRCISTGRACDGYGFQATRFVTASESPFSSLDIHSCRSERENRGLDYFKNQVLVELIGFDLKSDFWSCLVLQLSEASPAVLKAVLSFSSLHEFTYRQSAQKHEPVYRASHLRLYNKAIRQICLRQSTHSIQSILTCCILFICLENLSGHFDTALLHLKNGLEILKQWQVRERSSSGKEPITKIFQRLDIQATAFQDSRQPQLRMSPSLEVPTVKPAAMTFESLGQAQNELENIISKLFYIITTKSTLDYPSWSAYNAYLPVRNTLLQGLGAQFTHWRTAFDALSVQQSKNWRKEELRFSVLLVLHHHTTSLMLDIRSNTDIEGRYTGPSREPNWTRVNDICDSIIKSFSTQPPSFTADMGLIAPLYFTAMLADNIRTRQRSIDLLRTIQWKEGFWDARTAAAVADTTLRNHIIGIPENPTMGGIAELAKIHCVSCC